MNCERGRGDSSDSPLSLIEDLPPELLHHICGYLFTAHDPDRSVLATEVPSPLIDLAGTSRALRDAVETYCRRTLLSWASITKYDGVLPKPSKKVTKSHRGVLLRWRKTHCVFCGKKSVRKAVLRTGFGCCAKCDKLEWPDKITKTAAKKDYHLSDDHLFPDREDGLPVINYERLATAVHGDWKAHMAERQARAVAKQKRKAERLQGRSIECFSRGPDQFH
ncbi:hypothetical protein AAFC00_007081 [Neodothiora populina]|uniref:F-box domain-containing protein n=1 Tax=Neodothiora populina TaxID=2781224 RepID=A0ABR3PC81_9PEZI